MPLDHLASAIQALKHYSRAEPKYSIYSLEQVSRYCFLVLHGRLPRQLSLYLDWPGLGSSIRAGTFSRASTSGDPGGRVVSSLTE